MIRKHTLLTILFIYSGLIINAQEHKFKFGLLADYGILEPDVKGIVAEKYELFSTGSTLDGYRIGVFCNLKVRRGFWNSELSYFNNRSLIQFHNLRWQEDLAKYGTASTYASGMYLNNMVRLSINRGLIIAKSFSIEAGLIGAL